MCSKPVQINRDHLFAPFAPLSYHLYLLIQDTTPTFQGIVMIIDSHDCTSTRRSAAAHSSMTPKERWALAPVAEYVSWQRRCAQLYAPAPGTSMHAMMRDGCLNRAQFRPLARPCSTVHCQLRIAIISSSYPFTAYALEPMGVETGGKCKRTRVTLVSTNLIAYLTAGSWPDDLRHSTFPRNTRICAIV